MAEALHSAAEFPAQFKTCTKCNTAKPVSDFYKQKSKACALGVKAECKVCERERMRVWREANPQKMKTASQDWRSKNKARHARYNSDWDRANPEKASATRRRTHEKRRTSAKYRIDNAMRGAIHKGITKGAKAGRPKFTILGYTIDDLMTHLERQFLRGMDWDCYGEWEVDHILPLASFEFATPDDPEFKAAWALSNLRPMWSPDNRAKSDKILYLL